MSSIRGIKAGKAFIEMALDDRLLTRQLRGIQRRFRTLSRNLAGIGATLTVVGGSLLAPFAVAIQQAGVYQETLSRFEAVYGDLATAQAAWLDDFGSRVGRGRQELRDFASDFGDLTLNLGLDPRTAAEFSRTLTELSVDLGSFFNISDRESANRLLSGLRGSSEVLDKFNINIRKAALDAKLFEQSIEPNNATEQQKVLARLAIILDQTSRAQGDATRTGGSYTNQLKALQAATSNLSIEVGTALLPAMTRLLVLLRDSISPLSAFAQGNADAVVGAAAFAAAIAGLGVALTGIAGFALAASSSITALVGVIGLLGGTTTSIIVGLGLAVTGVAATFVDIETEGRQALNFLEGDFVNAINDVSTFLLNQDFEAAGELMMLTLSRGIRNQFESVTSVFSDVLNTFNVFGAQITDAATGIFDAFGGDFSFDNDAVTAVLNRIEFDITDNFNKISDLRSRAEAFRKKNEAEDKKAADERAKQSVRSGASGLSQADITAQSQQFTKEKEDADAKRAEEQTKRRAEQLAESLRTPLEELTDGLDEIEKLFADGLVTIETRERRRKELQEQFERDSEDPNAKAARERIKGEVESLAESVKTPAERLGEELKRAGELFDSNEIDATLFGRVISDARRELRSLRDQDFTPSARSEGAIAGTSALVRQFSELSQKSIDPAKKTAEGINKLLRETERQTILLQRQGTWK